MGERCGDCGAVTRCDDAVHYCAHCGQAIIAVSAPWQVALPMHGRVRCAAITRKGDPCAGSFPAARESEQRERGWDHADGRWYCPSHAHLADQATLPLTGPAAEERSGTPPQTPHGDHSDG